MTAKEKVLAYVRQWDGLGFNPANECQITFHPYENKWIVRFQERVGRSAVISASEHPLCESDSDWNFYARILKLDTPKAAEIQWEEDIYPPEPEVNLPAQQEWQSECGFYIVQLKGDDYHAVYEEGDYHREADLGYHSTPEAAKQACQDHKQKRLEDLL